MSLSTAFLVCVCCASAGLRSSGAHELALHLRGGQDQCFWCTSVVVSHRRCDDLRHGCYGSLPASVAPPRRPMNVRRTCLLSVAMGVEDANENKQITLDLCEDSLSVRMKSPLGRLQVRVRAIVMACRDGDLLHVASKLADRKLARGSTTMQHQSK